MTHASRRRHGGPFRVWAVTGLLVVVAAAIHTGYADAGPVAAQVTVPWPVFAVLFAVAESATVRMRIRSHEYHHTLSEAPLVLGLVLLSPTGLVLARLGGTAVALLRARQQPMKAVFNLSRLWAETLLAVVVYRAALGAAGAAEPAGLLAAAVAVVLSTAFALAMLVAAVALFEGTIESVRAFRWIPVTAAAVVVVNTSLGLLALVIVFAEPVALVLVAILGAVSYVAHASYGAWRRRHEGLTRLHAFTEEAGTLPAPLAAQRILRQGADLVGAPRALLVTREPMGSEPRLCLELQSDGTVVDGSAGELFAAAARVTARPRSGRLARWRERLAWTAPADVLVVPLPGKDGPIGQLVLADLPSTDARARTDDRQLLETFANHASVALENSRLIGQLWREIEERQHEATHDVLTGLPNRTLFHQQVTQAIARLAPGARLAVLLIDLDHFKAVNDTLGHHVGDRVLASLADALGDAVGSRELIARLGGDEFAVLLDELDGPADAVAAAHRLRDALATPAAVEGLSLELGASVGVALCPDDGQDSSTLLRRADVAMYLAKAARSGVERYEPERDPNTPRRLALVTGLRAALSRSEIFVEYQPKVALATGKIAGVEALARWRHPEHGLIPPDEFVPVAEQAALAGPLTRFVLRSVLGQWVAWQDEGVEVEIAVNLSPWNVLDAALVADLRALLDEHGVPAHALRLEITETGMLADPDRTARILEHVHALGVGLSIDDFGTGYASLSWLTRLPVDELKIDRTFLDDAHAQPSDEAIVRSTIELGRSLGLTVVAEGVEQVVTWERLRALGCHVAQGYLISRPLSPEAMLAWLHDHEGHGFQPGHDGRARPQLPRPSTLRIRRWRV